MMIAVQSAVLNGTVSNIMLCIRHIQSCTALQRQVFVTDMLLHILAFLAFRMAASSERVTVL